MLLLAMLLKHWTLTLLGKQLTDGELQLPELPDSALVGKFISEYAFIRDTQLTRHISGF